MLLNNRARDLLDNYTAGMAQHFGTQNPGRYFSLNDPQETALRLAMLESVEFLNWITTLDVDQLSGQVVTLDAPPQDGRMSWLVTFTLTEHISVQEKREARASGKTKAVKQTAGSGSGQNGSQAAGEDEEKLTWFERKVLKPVNDALG